MGQQTEILIGKTHLSTSTFVWPRYRGTDPQPVVIDVGIEVANKIIAELGSSGGETTLTVKGKSTSGADGGSNEVVIKGVIVERVVKVNQFRARLVLTDRRMLLTQFVFDLNFNLEFGEGFVEGTEAKTYKDALEKAINSIKALKDNFDSIESGVGDRPLPNRRVLAGLMVSGGLKALLSRANADLTVTLEGKFKFVSRNEDRKLIPSSTAFKWIEEPGFLAENIFISNKPKKIRTFYHERHCIRVRTVDPRRSDPLPGPDELKIELEQVYVSNGLFFTLEELLEEHGQNKNAISDAEIAVKITTGTFEGTNIESDGTVERDNIISAIKDGWRTLYRIVFTESTGTLGGWTDWKFGKLNKDGSISDVAVDCPYVEMLTAARPTPGQSPGTLIGVPMTQNHLGPSPFVAGWEQDASDRVIRFKAKKSKKTQGDIFPGKLKAPLTIQLKSTIEGWGVQETLKNFDITEKEPISKAKFFPDFEAVVFLTATRRAPNNEQMWQPVEVQAYPNGDIPFQELPPTTDLYANRDFVDGSTEHPEDIDGLGQLLNDEEVFEDAKLRTEIWKQEKTAAISGEGIASTLTAFKSVEISGPISRVELMIEGGTAVRTKIITGLAQDSQAQKETAMKRLSNMKINTSGSVELV